MKVFFYRMTVCGRLPPRSSFVFSQFVQEFVDTSARIFTVTAFFQFRDQVSRVKIISDTICAEMITYLTGADFSFSN